MNEGYLKGNTHLLLFSMLILLSACGGSSKDEKLAKYIKAVKSRSGQRIEPIPKYKPLEKFHYPENQVRRSPFNPTQSKKRENLDAPNIRRPKQFLEQYPLDSLHFVGVLKQGARAWGLIQLPKTGEIKRVKVGDYMGLNYGKILRITNKTVKLEERVNVRGVWERKLITLTIYSGNKE